jgi:protoporphyrinogen/coproporphyrinogen III oxidase
MTGGASGSDPVVVVGGGISGLTVAYRLARRQRPVVLIDGGDRPGGLIHSERRDGFLCEAGPDAIPGGAPDTDRLIDELGLGAEVIPARARARRRLLLLDGRLVPLPHDVLTLVASEVLSPRGKLRLLREPFIRPRPANDGGDDDEALLAFAERRLGPEAARHLVAPAAIGVFAGDAARLSVRSAFPRLHALEFQHGSLLRGLRALRQQQPSPLARGRLITFADGVERLPRTLAEALGPACRRGQVTRLAPGPGGAWLVHGGDEAAGAVLTASAVVLACGPADAAALLAPLAPSAAAALRAITVAPVTAVCLGWRQAPAALDVTAYGFLVPRGEAVTALGCQYQSHVFPGRAPAGGALVRVLLGGVFDPQVAAASDDDLIAQARAALAVAANIGAQPDFTAVLRGRGIPQYEVGHHHRVTAADTAVAALPGLHLLGYGLRGVGVNDCIREATALAARLTT